MDAAAARAEARRHSSNVALTREAMREIAAGHELRGRELASGAVGSSPSSWRWISTSIECPDRGYGNGARSEGFYATRASGTLCCDGSSDRSVVCTSQKRTKSAPITISSQKRVTTPSRHSGTITPTPASIVQATQA